jgi:hypothetical protein
MGLEKSDIPWNRPLKGAPTTKWEIARHDDGQLLREKQETVSSAHSEQCEAFKKTLEEKLAKGIDVRSQAEYDRLKNLVPNLGNVSFESMNGGVGITVKKVEGVFKVFNNPDSTQPYSK